MACSVSTDIAATSSSSTRSPARSSPCHRRHRFTYHPATGLYKVVHLPFHGEVGTFNTVNVFTLGDTSWREVPVRLGSSCLLKFGIVSVNGATYWVSNDGHSVMSFDLNGDERQLFVATLPVRVGLLLDLDIYCQLTTDMSGKLGVAVCSHDMKRNTTLKDQD
nr:unnamed protein product [Digitaria exilis]